MKQDPSGSDGGRCSRVAEMLVESRRQEQAKSKGEKGQWTAVCSQQRKGHLLVARCRQNNSGGAMRAMGGQERRYGYASEPSSHLRFSSRQHTRQGPGCMGCMHRPAWRARPPMDDASHSRCRSTSLAVIRCTRSYQSDVLRCSRATGGFDCHTAISWFVSLLYRIHADRLDEKTTPSDTIFHPAGTCIKVHNPRLSAR